MSLRLSASANNCTTISKRVWEGHRVDCRGTHHWCERGSRWTNGYANFCATNPQFRRFRRTTGSTGIPTFDASAWQLFIEGGSFVHWVVDTYGWPAWWEAYQTDDPATALGATGTELEDGWLAATRAQYPDPVPCEEALGAVGPREEFWCRRARGESTGR